MFKYWLITDIMYADTSAVYRQISWPVHQSKLLYSKQHPKKILNFFSLTPFVGCFFIFFSEKGGNIRKSNIPATDAVLTDIRFVSEAF